MGSNNQDPPMPFGYRFQHTQQAPDPPGPPLLDISMQRGLANFFVDPDAPNPGMEDSYWTNFGFDFGQGTDMMLTNADPDHGLPFINTHLFDTNSPLATRPTSTSQDHSQIQSAGRGNQAASGARPPASLSRPNGYDEGHMGANALLNMSQASAEMHRMNGSGSRDMTNMYSPGMQHMSGDTPGAVHYLSSTNIYLPNGSSNTGSNTQMSISNHNHSHMSMPRPVMQHDTIPQQLMFDSDQAFQYSGGPGGFVGYQVPQADRLSDQERIMQHMVYPDPFESTGRETPTSMQPVPARRSNGVAAKSPSTQRVSTPKEDKDEIKGPTVKRRKTQAPSRPAFESDIRPPPQNIKVESKAPHTESPASSPGPSVANSPAEKPLIPFPSGVKATPTSKKASGAGVNSKRQKLSEQQRKQNHIHSEQRRRAEMKEGYQRLDKLVPSLKSGGLSKSQVLQHTVIFLDGLVHGNREAAEKLKALLDRGKDGGTGTG